MIRDKMMTTLVGTPPAVAINLRSADSDFTVAIAETEKGWDRTNTTYASWNTTFAAIGGYTNKFAVTGVIRRLNFALPAGDWTIHMNTSNHFSSGIGTTITSLVNVNANGGGNLVQASGNGSISGNFTNTGNIDVITGFTTTNNPGTYNFRINEIYIVAQ